jgi:hypothetical protein
VTTKTSGTKRVTIKTQVKYGAIKLRLRKEKKRILLEESRQLLVEQNQTASFRGWMALELDSGVVKMLLKYKNNLKYT